MGCRLTAGERPLPDPRRLVLVTNVSGNASYEYSRAALLAVTEVEAPVEVTSQDLDDQLAEVLTRLRLPGSLLELSLIHI